MEHYKKFLVIFGVFGFILSSFIQPALAQEPVKEFTQKLSLKEATLLALQNNFDVQLTKYDTLIARTDEHVARSIYDTIFEAEVQYQDDQSKRTSTILGTKTVDNDYNIGLSKKLPTGTTVGMDLENNRNFNNATFASSSLTHDSSLGFTVEQDLGKNIFGIQDRGDVKITLLDIENAEYTSLNKIESSIAQVQMAYWDLVLQNELVLIEEGMVAEAKKLYDLHQEQLEDGLVETPEAIASEANYKSRKNSLILVQNQVRTSENALRLLLNVENNIIIEPTDHFNMTGQQEELVDALKNAFEHRQDFKKAQKEIEAKGINLSMKKNNLWPEINLTASLARNGLGDHFDHAIEDITDQNNPDFFAGLTITFPLENRKARGQLKAAELLKAKSLIELKLLERKIAVEISDQVRNCNIYQELAQNSKAISDLQNEKLEEEKKRFRYGRSDTDTLIRFQEDLVQAKDEVIVAIHRYHVALIELNQKQGKLLKSYWEAANFSF